MIDRLRQVYPCDELGAIDYFKVCLSQGVIWCGGGDDVLLE